MTPWPEVELGKVCEFKYGRSLAAGHRDGGQFPVYGSNGVVGGHSTALTNGPTVIIGRKGSFGEVAYSVSACWPIDTTYYIDGSATTANLKWLSYRLRKLGLASLNRAAAIPGLNREDAYRQRLLLPPLGEQRRIAAVLDHADAIRAKRRQVLAHLDVLPQAIFHDTFGDDAGVGHVLGEVADFFGGASLPAGERYDTQSGGTLLMKVSDMNSSGNEDEIIAASLWTASPTTRSATVSEGAVVLPKRGASIATNKKRLTTRRTALDPNLMGVQPKAGKISSRYLYEWFKPFDLATITSGSTVPQLNKQDLSPLPIAVPTLSRQHEFADQVTSVNVRRDVVRRAIATDDELFESLQARAFRGEL